MVARDLTAHDIILVSTSAGKDSLAMLHEVCAQAEAQGVRDRVVAVHCDLGEVEWQGTRELAEEQAKLFNVPFHVITRRQGGLLQQVEERGKWMSPAVRYCTSYHKRDQVPVLITQLVEAYLLKTTGRRRPRKGKGPVRVLTCIGLRAQESTKRAEEPVWSRDERASSGVREITRWLPIHHWSEEQVWATIRSNSLPYHYAYDLGMPRLSCCFCIYAPEPALLLSGYHNRALLTKYVEIEGRIGHAFQHDSDTGKNIPLVLIQTKLEQGWEPQGKVAASAWGECSGGM